MRLWPLAALALACAGHGPSGPEPVRAYHVLIEGRDTLSEALARALAERGVSVERHVHGGGPRAAALIAFTYRDPVDSARWLAVRLADTRSGVLVAAVSVPLDSLGPAATSARMVTDSLLGRAP